MAKYTGPSCRLCRRERMKLFLKGTKCYTPKCPFERRSNLPGKSRKLEPKLSDFGLHLREKQKVKRMYSINERQFKGYFLKSRKAKDITGIKLLQFLQRRLDNLIVCLGFATSHVQARQLVTHGYISVNGRKVNIPSYIVKAEDVIKVVRSGKKGKQLIKDNLESTRAMPRPSWVEVNPDTLTGKVLRLPERGDINLPIKEQMIVELYSK